MSVFTDRYGNLRLPWMFAAVFGVFAVACAVLAYGIVFPFDKRDCRIAAQGQGVERKYVNWSGCYLKTEDGKFVPKDQFRAVVR